MTVTTPDPAPEKPRHSMLEVMAHCGTVLQGIFTVAATILSILAVTWGYAQWTREKTLEFQNEWTSLDMINARTSIVDAMTCNLDKASPESAQAQNPADPWEDGSFFPDEYLLAAATPTKSYRGLDREMGVGLGFFQAVNNCVGRVCNTALACELFRDDAQQFKTIFDPYLHRQRVIFGPGYGRDFDRFLATCPKRKSPPEQPLWEADEQRALAKELAALTVDLQKFRDPTARSPNSEIVMRIGASCSRMAPDGAKASPAKTGG